MNKDNFPWQDDDDDGRTGTGGKSGDIHYRFKTEIYRDEQLSAGELKHLLQIHQDKHKALVDKQKILKKEREFLKEGRKDLVEQHRNRHGLGGGVGGRSQYKQHPISKKAQFSGIDRQISHLPTENTAQTNPELQERLENRHVPRNQPTKQFNPKPRPY